MINNPITGFRIIGRRGHWCAIFYEDDRYTEAMYAVHKWRQEGLLDMDESSHLINQIATDAGVDDGAADGRVGRDPAEGARGAGA